MTVIDLPTETSRVKRLKAETHDMHEALDQRIMRAAPFSSRERYGAFLKMQHQFHRDLDALYVNPVLDRLLPDLEGRRRLHLVAQDLTDLDLSAPDASEAPVFAEGKDADLPTALGWLYVAEGSNLGAAFLLKEAAKLDLSESFGARHLAAAPEGRGLPLEDLHCCPRRAGIDASRRRTGGRRCTGRIQKRAGAGQRPSSPTDDGPLRPTHNCNMNNFRQPLRRFG